MKFSTSFCTTTTQYSISEIFKVFDEVESNEYQIKALIIKENVLLVV